MRKKMIKISVCAAIFTLLVDFSVAGTIDGSEAGSVVLPCDLAGSPQYPTWTGPEALQNPINNGTQINEGYITWASNNKDLNITYVRLAHNGTWTCSDGTSSADVDLNVLYFSGTFTHYSNDAIRDGLLEIKCGVVSNPEIEPQWVIMSAFQGRSEITPVTCGVQSPLDLNSTVARKECTVTYRVTQPVIEDSGIKVTCYYNRNGTTKEHETTLDLYYPPATINMIDEHSTINETGDTELRCYTDYSNPVSDLRWFKGKSPNPYQNTRLNGGSKTTEHGQHNGVTVSEQLTLLVTDQMHGEKVYCCVYYRNNLKKDLCVSREIVLHTSSASLASPSVLLLVCCWSVLYGMFKNK